MESSRAPASHILRPSLSAPISCRDEERVAREATAIQTPPCNWTRAQTRTGRLVLQPLSGLRCSVSQAPVALRHSGCPLICCLLSRLNPNPVPVAPPPPAEGFTWLLSQGPIKHRYLAQSSCVEILQTIRRKWSQSKRRRSLACGLPRRSSECEALRRGIYFSDLEVTVELRRRPPTWMKKKPSFCRWV